MNEQPCISYWHLWTDSDGISHQTRCVMSDFTLKAIQSQAAPQWQAPMAGGAMTTMFTVLPVGWVGAWHENPKPQWIIPLSGRWFVEAMDGTRAEFGPGEISFGGDQNCSARDGKQGHKSGTLGEVPAVLMIVQWDDRPAPMTPCALS